MAVYSVNLILYTGTDFEQTFILANDFDETVLDLNGYTVSSKMKKHPTSLTSINLHAAIVSFISGKVKLSLSAAETSNLKPGRYFYDIVITKDGNTGRVVEGEVFVKKAVTR